MGRVNTRNCLYSVLISIAITFIFAQNSFSDEKTSALSQSEPFHSKELSGSAKGSTPATDKQAILLEVPYINQREKGSGWDNCGPASVAMVLSYFGKGPASQNFMHKVCPKCNKGIYQKKGVGLADIQAALNAYRIAWKPAATWQSISAALQNKNPIIILVNIKEFDVKPYPNPDSWTGKEGACNHWVVITGYNDKNVYINDSLAKKDFIACEPFHQCGQNWRVSKESFLQAAGEGPYTAIGVEGVLSAAVQPSQKPSQHQPVQPIP